MKNLIILILLALGFTSCSTLNKSRMLKTPLNYKFQTFNDSAKIGTYKISIDDEISIQMYSNDGYNFISLSTSISSEGNNNNNGGNRGGSNNSFKVRSDSTIKVPVIGSVKVVGLDLVELESKIEEILKAHVNQPFVIARIYNRRVYLFNGGSNAALVELENQNTTLFEILAMTGGIDENSNASRIKLIRGDLNNPEIYLIDVSTIEGMKQANLTLKAGDIIYIDPFINYSPLITGDIGSILGLISSFFLIYSFSDNLNN